MSLPKVLIVIPAYNESGSIRELVQTIKREYPTYTPLVINDGSKDTTRDEAVAGGASIVTHPFNLGIGGAVQTGYKVALKEKYDAVIQLDGDAQHDPAFLHTILEPVLSDKLDLCIGSRFLTTSSHFKSTFTRRIGIRFFANLLSILTGIHLTDPTSGFRATGKKLIPYFADYYPIDFPEPEAIKIANRLSARIGEVPVNMRERKSGVSSIRYFATLYYMIKVTFAILVDLLKEKK